MAHLLRRLGRRPEVGRGEPSPDLSVVVVVHDMAREAPRTLLSLSAGYQRTIDEEAYEVVVIDNGSDPPLDPHVVSDLPGTFRLIRIDDAAPSPAQAINKGLAAARGGVVGVMIDGARLATPGLLHFALHGARLHDRTVVGTLGWHLGFDIQPFAIEAGYNEVREDRLLADIDWPADGYRLFEIGALDGSSIDGWFRPINESNALFMRREMWEELHGVDERFDRPGGGFLNLDLLRRALELPKAEYVVLLGEGTFHQLHGGIFSNATFDQRTERIEAWLAQYQKVRGKPWASPVPHSQTYLGVLPQAALTHFLRAAIAPMAEGTGPLGGEFDRGIWSLRAPVLPRSPRDATLVNLAHAELREGRYAGAAAVSRLARRLAPDEPEPQRVLSIASSWLRGPASEAERPAEVHSALGDAYALMGESDAAIAEYHAALSLDGALGRAHLGLSSMLLPGIDYMEWLTRLHRLTRPAVYLEIGVASGRTLALARPPTIAVGVDPVPTLVVPVTAETHMFAEPSDDFFALGKLDALLGDRRVSFAFIDGLHTFEQALRDFMNVEASSSNDSVIVFHDTLPLDERTQRRERETQFWTGDVWKVVLCLRRYRPDLEIFTIATPPSGLTVVCNLDPGSSVLQRDYDRVVDQYMNAPFSAVADSMKEQLSVIPNDWDLVLARLKARGLTWTSW